MVSKQAVLDAIEHYRDMIDEDENIIGGIEQELMNPEISESKKQAFERLVEATETHRSECQAEILRLLNE